MTTERPGSEQQRWRQTSRVGALALAASLIASIAAAAPAAAQEPFGVTVYHSLDELGADPRPGAPPGCQGSVAADGFLASTGSTSAALIRVDPVTGAGTFVGPLNSFGPVTEIELRSDGVLFGATGGGSSNLITIDPLTGAETLVATHEFGALNGLEFVGSTLYGAHIPDARQPSQLVVVDHVTGALTFIGPTGFGPIGGLAYDPSTGVLYGATASAVGGGDLIAIDLATGAGTLIGPTGFGHVAALEFGAGGVLFAGLAGGNLAGEEYSDAGSLITIDPATGAGTLVGPSGYPGLTGLSAASAASSCVIRGGANEELKLWIDGGPSDSGEATVCMLGEGGGTGDELCGADLLFELSGVGELTRFEPDLGMDTLVYKPDCAIDEGSEQCLLPPGTTQLRMNFLRGLSNPGTGPQRLGSLFVNSTGLGESTSTTVTAFGEAAGANLQARPIASAADPEVVAVSNVPEPGQLAQLVSGLFGIGLLYRLRRRS